MVSVTQITSSLDLSPRVILAAINEQIKTKRASSCCPIWTTGKKEASIPALQGTTEGYALGGDIKCEAGYKFRPLGIYIGLPSTEGFEMEPHQTEGEQKQGITTRSQKAYLQIDYSMPRIPRLSGKAFRKASIPTQWVQAELERDLFRILCW